MDPLVLNFLAVMGVFLAVAVGVPVALILIVYIIFLAWFGFLGLLTLAQESLGIVGLILYGLSWVVFYEYMPVVCIVAGVLFVNMGGNDQAIVSQTPDSLS